MPARGETSVFEVGKDNIHAVVFELENRTGKKIEFESSDAEKDFRAHDYRPLIDPSRKDME
jgi:hypothetical protein